MHDPALGRWFNIDLMAEKYYDLSPYNFTFNNPLRFVDPDGQDPIEVIDKASSFIGTSYQWGGKNPDARAVGIKRKANDPTITMFAQDISLHFKNIYNVNNMKPYYNFQKSLGLKSGCSFGIDCSGLARKAFNADSDKLMDDIVAGTAHDQMKSFVKASTEGTGELHFDAENVGAGDLVFRTNKKGKTEHVMVATGNVKANKNGKVTQIEVIHAPASGKFVKKEYKKVKGTFRYGHTFRQGDKIPTNGNNVERKQHYDEFKKSYQTVVN